MQSSGKAATSIGLDGAVHARLETAFAIRFHGVSRQRLHLHVHQQLDRETLCRWRHGRCLVDDELPPLRAFAKLPPKAHLQSRGPPPDRALEDRHHVRIGRTPAASSAALASSTGLAPE
jgi:hypothetical protein